MSSYLEITHHKWVNFEGRIAEFEDGKLTLDCQKIKMRAALDETGQLYILRTDGVKIFFRNNATRHVMHSDGTLITHHVMSEEETSLKSDPKNGRKSDLAMEDSFTMYSMMYDMEHPSYYRVRSANTLSVQMPEQAVISKPAKNSYTFSQGNDSFCFIKEKSIQIYSLNQKELGKTIDLERLKVQDTLQPNGEPRERILATKIEFKLGKFSANEKEVFLSSVDSRGRGFTIYTDGTTNYTPPFDLDTPNRPNFEKFNKVFVLNRELNGCEFSCDNEEQTSEWFYVGNNSPKKDYLFSHKPTMVKKELSRYLEFPKNDWLMNLPLFVDPCDYKSKSDMSRNYVHVEGPKSPVLWRQKSRMENFGEFSSALMEAVRKYKCYQNRILRLYRKSLAKESAYNTLAYEPIIGLIKIENEDEMKRHEQFRNIDPNRKRGLFGLAIG
ncbi:Hypothetical protein NTJ_13460 [Nesidiocoris tenuis]|uniref:Uncharacterized protein n=1 Tax=Nesidiocoris tenuis TaxID=355587 RepID=A0ABN7B8R2_9HEMI|nr:Hypothetical protein NTJ_13460 [Nesidiocoris tenuis]